MNIDWLLLAVWFLLGSCALLVVLLVVSLIGEWLGIGRLPPGQVMVSPPPPAPTRPRHNA